MVQSLNLAAVRTTARVILREPALALPHQRVRDISELDFAELREAGCHGVIFDKDNTLTAPYSDEVHPRWRARCGGASRPLAPSAWRC